MTYQTNDYRCLSCGNIDTLLVERALRDDLQSCSACGSVAGQRMFGGNITRVTYVDGTKRWDGVRLSRELEKQRRKLMRDRVNGKIDYTVQEEEDKRLVKEQDKIKKKGASLKADLPPKVEH